MERMAADIAELSDRLEALEKQVARDGGEKDDAGPAAQAPGDETRSET